MDERRFSGFLDSLYAAAAEPDEWRGLAGQLADLFGTGSCLVRLVNRRNLSFNLVSVTSNMMDRAGLYERYYQYRDPWSKFVRTHRNRTYVDSQMLPEREWTASECFNEHSSKIGIHKFLGAAIDVDEDSFGVFAVHRDRAGYAFDDADQSHFERLVPHFRRAVRVRRQLGPVHLQRDASLAALEHLEVAAFVVCDSGRISFANALAISLIARLDGISMHNEVLRATSPAGEPLLKAIAAVACAFSPPTHALPAPFGLRATNGAKIATLVSPFPLHGHAALVLMRDPATHKPAPATLLRAMLGLSQAEAEVAAALTTGETLEEIAGKRRTTLNTVRNQVKSALGKTGASRQSELVALVMRQSALFFAPDGSCR